jgi:6-phosphogluconolactonase
MTDLIISCYDKFNLLAHMPKGEENKNHFICNKKIYTFPEIYNPAFILIHPKLQYIYVCSESIYNGTLSTFSFDNNKNLKLVKTVSSKGKSSCYLCFDKMMKNIININYWDSTISVHPLKNNVIQEAKQVIYPKIENDIYNIEDHLKDRQNTSHHHSCVFKNNYLFVPDLGKDKIDIYQYTKETLKYKCFFQLPKGRGPRYSIIEKEYLYVINELSSSISVIKLIDDLPNEIIQNISTIPENILTKNTCGTIQIHPSKKYIYASNRGHDSIAIYKILENKLKLIDITKTGGKTPRHFSINNIGDKLYVANQDSNKCVIFNINSNGSLEIKNENIKINSPNFILKI